MSSFRYNADGSISFVQRGNPPTEVDGYIPDPYDKWRFYPDLGECEYRKVETEQTSCCGERNKLCCDFMGLPISLQSCKNCTYPWLMEQMGSIKDPVYLEDGDD